MRAKYWAIVEERKRIKTTVVVIQKGPEKYHNQLAVLAAVIQFPSTPRLLLPYRSGFPSNTSRKFALGNSAAQHRRITSFVSTSKNCA